MAIHLRHRAADYANFSPMSIDVAGEATIWNSAAKLTVTMLLTTTNSPTVNTLLKHIAARGNGRESDGQVGVKGWSLDGGANYYERVGRVSSTRHQDIIRFDPRMPFGTSR